MSFKEVFLGVGNGNGAGKRVTSGETNILTPYVSFFLQVEPIFPTKHYVKSKTQILNSIHPPLYWEDVAKATRQNAAHQTDAHQLHNTIN
jgi:hypothetical protein